MLKRVYIEIMNRCNLHCSFCPSSTRPARTMSADEFDRLATEVSPLCSYIYLHIKGEPLLHPQLDEILASAERHGLMVNLTTNGLLLPDHADLLHSAPALRQTNLSLHGYTSETHGTLSPWLESLCSYARKQAELGHFTVFRFWTLPESRKPGEQETAMLDFLEKAFCQPPGNIAVQAGGRSISLAKGIFVSFDSQFQWPSLEAPDLGESGSCRGAREMIGILADGTVVPCCLDSEGCCNLGNAFETPLEQLLASHRLTDMAEGFRQRKVLENICRRCGYRQRFSPKAKGERSIGLAKS